MWDTIQEALSGAGRALGLGAEDLGVWQMALRAAVVYVAAVLMIRVGEKRFMGKNTAFDVILGIVFGSVVSRAVTGNAPFFPTLFAGFVLVGLHWVFAAVAFRSDRFGALVKGRERVLVEGGEVRRENMRKSHISERDLREALRLRGQITDPAEAESAHFERSGDISVIPRRREPRVLEISVERGVQTVRVELT